MEEKKKGNGGLIVLVVILLLACVGMGAFIFINKDILCFYKRLIYCNNTVHYNTSTIP